MSAALGPDVDAGPTGPDEEDDPIERLVRRAPSEWRRLALVTAAWIVAAGLVFAARPIVIGGAGGSFSASGGGTARIEASVTNQSFLPIEVVGFDVPEGITAMSLVGGPVRIPGRSTVPVAMTLRGVDCERVDRYERTVTVRTRIELAGVDGPPRRMTVEVPFGGSPETVPLDPGAGTIPPGSEGTVTGVVNGLTTGWLAFLRC